MCNIWPPEVGCEDVQILIQQALVLLVRNGAACFHLSPLDPHGASDLDKGKEFPIIYIYIYNYVWH